MRALCILSLVILTPATTQASGFVYAALGTASCVVSPCLAPQLVVVDADTASIVVRLPLPVHTVPAGIAMSADGRHLYVSNRATDVDAVPSITVVDARHHSVEGTFPTGGVWGALAARGDGSRVFLTYTSAAGGGPADSVAVFDTSAHTVTVLATIDPFIGQFTDLVVDAATDRLIVAELVYVGNVGFLTGPTGILRAYDAGTLTKLAEVHEGLGGPVALALSPDGLRLHELRRGYNSPGGIFRDGQRAVTDAATLVEQSVSPARRPGGTPAEIARSGELLYISSPSAPEVGPAVLLRSDLATGVNRTVEVSGTIQDFTVAAGERRVYVGTVDPAKAIALASVDLDANAQADSVRLTAPAQSGAVLLAHSPAGVPTCRYGVDTSFSSQPAAGGAGSVRLSTDCAWDASASDSWIHLDKTTGFGAATIVIRVDRHVLPTPRSATVVIAGQRVTVTQSGLVSGAPFGAFDTPADGADGISGSLAVTGWALDDVGVAGVRIFRDTVAGETPGLIYIGDASFVDGARPDVQAIFPSAPFNTRAGWGYLLLTNVLPAGGNGTFRLHAIAEDVEGHTTLLGSKTVTLQNSGATLPFGAIDTPGQGELVSGLVINFGWALTPQPASITADGSTIDVIIDGVFAGHPTYGNARSDIQALFPGYANTDGAVGSFTFDTRTLSNGTHTISWIVRDSMGRASGIGSRFFRVFNASSPTTAGGG